MSKCVCVCVCVSKITAHGLTLLLARFIPARKLLALLSPRAARVFLAGAAQQVSSAWLPVSEPLPAQPGSAPRSALHLHLFPSPASLRGDLGTICKEFDTK